MVQYLHNSGIHTNVLKFSHTCQLTVLISLESSFGFTDSYLHFKLGPNCVVLLQLYWIFSVEKKKYDQIFLLHTEYPIQLQQYNTIWA